jgi:hypothetical protein
MSLSDATWAFRRGRKQVNELLRGHDRLVDFGIVLHVVRQDPDGELQFPGLKARLTVVRTHHFGGMFDTLAKKWCGPTLSPVVWYLSEEQEPIVIHGESLPESALMQGSMGAGKTTGGAIWLALRVVLHATHPLKGAGVTAPTDKRMEEIRKTIFGPKDRNGERVGGMWPRQWATFREGDQVATVCTGLQIDFRSTHIQSATAGSPIQGQNWAFCLNDELQDYYEIDGDIQMRGRAAWNGRYERFVTVTPKDDPGYRIFRDTIATLTTDWIIQKVLGPNSPFIDAEYWEKRRRGMSLREFQRKVLALDVASENVVYNAWSHDENIRPIQQVPRWPDVTRAELSKRANGQYHILVGFDPGRLFDVSVLLKAYQPPAPPRAKAPPAPVWFIVGEVTTERSTTEHHCRALLKVLREQWGCNLTHDGPQAFVSADPYGDTANDEDQPDLTVYRVFQAHGLHIKAAAYKAGSTKAAKVPKEGRLDMMNTLLCNAAGERRLFVACNDNRVPCAPKFVEAVERLERDGDNRAERDRKDANDLTHWPCAAGYALWAIEKPRLEAMAS